MSEQYTKEMSAEWSALVCQLRQAVVEQKALRAQRSAMVLRKQREGALADQIEFNDLTTRIKQLDVDRRELNGALDALKAIATAAGSGR